MDMLVYKNKQLEAQYNQLKKDYDLLHEMSRIKAMRIMSLGLFVIAGHFGFVSAGTYFIWSWDIVEPLAYFNTAFAGIVLTTSYFWTRQDYTNQTYCQY